jgi:hypothetical protein
LEIATRIVLPILSSTMNWFCHISSAGTAWTPSLLMRYLEASMYGRPDCLTMVRAMSTSLTKPIATRISPKLSPVARWRRSASWTCSSLTRPSSTRISPIFFRISLAI